MTGILGDHDTTVVGCPLRHPFKIRAPAVWFFIAIAALVSGGCQAATIVRDAVPRIVLNVVNRQGGIGQNLRYVLSESSRFVFYFQFDNDDLYGKLELKYEDPVGGEVLQPLVMKNVTDRQITLVSHRLDLKGANVTLRMAYTIHNGPVIMNATFILTPYTDDVSTYCATDEDCRRYSFSYCRDGVCKCRKGTKVNRQRRMCASPCVASSDCTNLASESECLRGQCVCKRKYLETNGTCSYNSECNDDLSCGLGICHEGYCVCPAGFWRPSTTASGACHQLPCKTKEDCGFWSNMDCATTIPGTTDKFCTCKKGHAYLEGACNPLGHLGPCPYDTCTVEYSECRQPQKICYCKEGYVLRTYNKHWACEKQAIETVNRPCTESSECYTGEICEDNFCTCPKGKELKDLKCIDVVLVDVKTNIGLLLWLSAVMLALVVVFLSFGCCLYLLAQRAENEQKAIAEMFDASENFEIKGTA